MTTTASFTGGPGTFVIADDTPAAIVAFTTAWSSERTLNKAYLTANWSPAGSQTINTPIACLSKIAVHMGSISTNIGSLQSQSAAIVSGLKSLNTSIATLTTGLASIQGTMNRSLIVQELAYVDQQENNKFQQTATNAALKDAGKPPVVVEPADRVETLKKNLKSVSDVKIQVASTSILTNVATDTASDALTYAGKWFLTTKVGAWSEAFYLDAKKDVSAFFALETSKKTETAATDLAQATKAK